MIKEDEEKTCFRCGYKTNSRIKVLSTKTRWAADVCLHCTAEMIRNGVKTKRLQ